MKKKSLACLLVIDQKSLAVYCSKNIWKYVQRGNADIVEEFAHISNLQVNKKTEIGDKIGLSTHHLIKDIEFFTIWQKNDVKAYHVDKKASHNPKKMWKCVQRAEMMLH